MKTIEQFRNNEFVVHCETEEEAKELVRFCYKNGMKWSYGCENSTFWYGFKKDTCYRFNTEYKRLGRCNINYYKSKNIPIITYKEFINKLKGENKTMKLIEGKDLLNEKLEVLEDGTLRVIEKKGKFIPEWKEKYYYIDRFGTICCSTYEKLITDEYFIKHNLVFRTEQECKEYKKYLDVLDKYSYEFSNEEWEDEKIKKRFIGYSNRHKEIYKNYETWIKQEKTYFRSEDDISSFVEEVGEENIERFMFNVWE